MKSKGWYNNLSNVIFHASLEVHKEMGPGLLESVYEYCLMDELNSEGVRTEGQVNIPLHYKGKDLKKDFRIDILVENEILIEIKAVEDLHSIHEAQLLSYLKLTDKWLGFLINFNVPLIKNGFKQFVNGYI